MRHELLPIADAEYGNALGKDSWIDRRAACLIDAVRSAGNDETLPATEFASRSLARPHFRRDTKVADLSGDEMAILAARVQDGDLRCIQTCVDWRLAVVALYALHNELFRL